MESIQDQKNYQKLELLSILIKNLSEYNSIEGYNNQKNFNIIIDKKLAKDKDKCLYLITIKRGINKPKEIFKMRFVSENSSLEIFDVLIKSINSNKLLNYTCLTKDYNDTYNLLSLHLKGNTKLDFKLKNEDDIKRAIIVSNRLNSNYIKVSIDEKEKDKDIIQIEKAKKILDTYFEMLNQLIEYNNIENYINIKPFIFEITNYFDYKKNCYSYNLKINRGFYNIDEIIKFKISIKNKDIINKMLLLYLKQYSDNGIFTYNSDDDIYDILLANNIYLKFKLCDKKDKRLCEEILDNKEEKKLKL